ncbi:MAG: undecaprenyldiphospho-muramoylpentapeptide beta-N-acetylglucosaminyltransferase [Lachnospiraceae bacterium]
MKKIILTGGGTAGHVTPNIALLPSLKEAGFDVEYIGSIDGIERKLIEEFNIPYHGISTGKLRRYLDVKNLTDPFKVLKGYQDALKLMKELKPDIVFSKGGFVSVPVVLAAKARKIPVISHESDMTPGLANKIAKPAATKICCNFPETVALLPKNKAVLTGTPIRQELLQGNRLAGLEFCGFNTEKPVIMVVGGSTGAVHVNDAIHAILPRLLEKFQVVHLCGKGKLDEKFKNIPGYIQFEYVNKELRDVFAAADIVISRAGANAICELLALKKPNLLIPLSARASRGDQILNARSFKEQGFSLVLDEDEMTEDSLYDRILELYENRQKYIDAMESGVQSNAIPVIMDLIKQYTK